MKGAYLHELKSVESGVDLKEVVELEGKEEDGGCSVKESGEGE